jgi:hypothetical protein
MQTGVALIHAKIHGLGTARPGVPGRGSEDRRARRPDEHPVVRPRQHPGDPYPVYLRSSLAGADRGVVLVARSSARGRISSRALTGRSRP